MAESRSSQENKNNSQQPRLRHGFKHKVENWTRSDTNSEQGRYISEDSFNQAMRDSKFRLEPTLPSWREFINKIKPRSFFFNISFKKGVR